MHSRSVELAHGRLAFAEAGGAGAPVVVLLHQTPRSCDEYRDVLPLLAAGGRRAIAFDTPGFGDSQALPGGPTIERWAATLLAGLDALGVAHAAVAGHHTGGTRRRGARGAGAGAASTRSC